MNESADSIALRLVAETEAAERELAAYGARVQQLMAEVERSAERGTRAVEASARRQQVACRTLGSAIVEAAAQAKGVTIEAVDPKQLEAIGAVARALKDDLAAGLTQAIVAGKSLGDVLVDSFARAGAALLRSQIVRVLDPKGDGSAGLVKEVTSVLGGLLAARAPARASGGHVSAGQLYRVNEAGVEGFRPAGSGTIVPLGRMAAPRGASVTVVQPLEVSFAGAITTPALMAEFKAYADRVGQAAAMGGAAIAEARIAKRAARTLG